MPGTGSVSTRFLGAYCEPSSGPGMGSRGMGWSKTLKAVGVAWRDGRSWASGVLSSCPSLAEDL